MGNNANNPNKCSICYNDFQEIDKVITSCNHSFHFSCIIKNFKYNSSSGYKCPLCRKDFLPDSNSSNTYSSVTEARRREWDIWRAETIRQNRLQAALARRNVFISSTPSRNISRVPVRRGGQNSNRVVPTFSRRERRIREEIESYITDLTFEQIKIKLREKNVSSRGYMRTSLEKRLFNKLLSERLAL